VRAFVVSAALFEAVAVDFVSLYVAPVGSLLVTLTSLRVCPRSSSIFAVGTRIVRRPTMITGMIPFFAAR